MAPKSSVADWTVDDVSTFLDELSLSHLTDYFRKNAIDGKYLLELTDEDMLGDLQCSRLQVKKIRKALGQDTESKPQRGAGIPNASPVGFVRPQIDRHILEKYKALSENIKEKESQNVEESAKKAYQHLQQLQISRKSTFELLCTYEEAEAQAQKKLEKLDGWYPGKLIPGKLGEEKRAEKKEGREGVLHEASENVRKEKEQLLQMDIQLEQAQESWTQMNSLVEDYRRSLRERNVLLENLFTQPEWSAEPTISRLKSSLNVIKSKSSELNQYRQKYLEAQEILTKAKNKIVGALQALQRTRLVGMFEMGVDLGSPFMRPPGSIMMDMTEMMMVEQANELVKSAANDYLAAKQILPALPFQNDPAVDAARTGVFISLLAPGMIGNMAQQMMVRKSMQTVEEIHAGVNQCLEYCRRNIDAINMDLSRAESEVAVQIAELQSYQEEQLESALRET